MRKCILTTTLTGILTISMGMTALAGWEQEGTNWKYNDNGTYAANGWKWIDGNNDGIAESYYFDNNGILSTNTTTPDGYTVNADGAWTVNGVVQTQGVATNTNTNGSYDANYPLKGYVEAFNLLEEPATTRGMWTYQKESHYDTKRNRRIGYNKYYLVSTLSGEQHGTYSGIDEFDTNLTAEVKKFLNSFDWRNASDKEKAEMCLARVSQATYVLETDSPYGQDVYYAYGCLVNGQSVCEGYTHAFKLLANVVGLECTVYPISLHAKNMVKIDGQWYDIDSTYDKQLDLSHLVAASDVKWE